MKPKTSPQRHRDTEKSAQLRPQGNFPLAKCQRRGWIKAGESRPMTIRSFLCVSVPLW